MQRNINWRVNGKNEIIIHNDSENRSSQGASELKCISKSQSESQISKSRAVKVNNKSKYRGIQW